jgi:CubicO group peptidase (beta-lactamase class C family)
MFQVKTPFTPEQVGYDSSRVEALNRHFERLISNKEIHAYEYCLSRDNKFFAQGADGKFSHIDTNRDIQPDTVFAAASITKMFTTTAIFKLAEDGFIRLYQTAGSILKEMDKAPYNEITLAQLLSHTSGLYPDGGCYNEAGKISPWGYIAGRPDLPWIEAALAIGMNKKPGEQWQYCSFGFVLLGEVIARVTGMRAEEYIRKEILEPCEMNSSGFVGYFKDQKTADNIADRMYVHEVEDDKEAQERITELRTLGNSAKGSPFENVPQTAGSLVTTSADLCNFGNMLMNGGTFKGKRILGRRVVARMTERFTLPTVRDYCWTAKGEERAYALGPDLRRTADSFYSKDTFFHEGSGGCCLIVDPLEKLVAAWFVPYVNNVWSAPALYNAAAVIWSGLI